jgi:hypothetical protein
MGARVSPLDTFRSEWVCGHLDYQRAADELEATRQVARQLRIAEGISNDEVRRAEEDVENARRRLSEVGAILAERFDRFCGVAE